jgi:peptidoglycan/LPS O-acetylase OafA/YrhL
MQTLFGWKILLFPMGIVAAISALILVQIGISSSAFWFWYDFVLNHIPIFMTGIILFFLVQENTFQPDLRRDIAMFLLVSAVGVFALKMNLFIVLPLVSAISFAFLFNILRLSIQTDGWIERIGRVSYSMYIFHFAVVLCSATAVSTIFPAQGAWENVAYAMALAISIAATFLISRVSERHIEQRFIAYGRVLTSRSPAFVRDGQQRTSI